MWVKKRKLKNRYDSTADFYDRRYRDIQRRKFRAILEDLEGGRRVLDVGCGTGLFLEEISNLVGLVVGVDFSADMLKEARNRSDSSFLVLADADNLPFPDESFDTVVSFTLLQNMPDPEVTIREMARVAKSGGKVIVTGLGKKHKAEEVENWMTSASLKPLRVGKISDSEDVVCVGRRER